MATKKERQKTSFTYDGKRYYVYGYSARELKQKEHEKRKELEEGEAARLNPKLDEYFERFIARHRLKVKEVTIHGIKQLYKTCSGIKIYGKRFGGYRIRDVRPADVLELQRQLTEKGIATATVNRYMTVISQLFTAAVRDETIDRTPCRAVSRIRRTEAQARDNIHRALTVEETEVFLDAAKTSRYYNAYRLMLNTGLRIGEVGALVPSDVDLKAGMLHVTKTLTRTESGAVTVGDTPKTSSGCRDIPLTRQIIAIIRDQQDINAVIRIGGRRQIFLTPHGNYIYSDHLSYDLARICKRAGIEKFTCHALRATFATRFIEQRPQDFKILSEILGHSDTRITLDLYTHVMRDKKIEAMESLDLAF